MKKSLIVKLEGTVDHTGLKRPGVLSFKIGQYIAPSYAANLTTDVSDECYLLCNGSKKTSAYFQATEVTNDIEIHGTYLVKILPTFDANSHIDFAELGYFINLANLDLTNSANNVHVNGNIESFGRLLNLSQLKLNYAQKNKVVGSVNKLLDSLYANGKHSGSLYIYSSASAIAYNGSEVVAGFSKHFDFSAGGWSERA